MRRSHRVALVLALAVVVLTGAFAFADKWRPYDFKGAAFYKYRITHHDRNQAKQVVYSFETKPAADTPGGDLWEVTTTTQTLMKAEDLRGAAIFGASPVLSMVPLLMMGNPMFTTMIGEMDLAVGEKMSFFGAGKAEVVGKETVAGVEGFRCNLYVKQGDEQALKAELVVHPDLAFPMRSKVYEGDKVQFEMELLEYRKP